MSKALLAVTLAFAAPPGSAAELAELAHVEGKVSVTLAGKERAGVKGDRLGDGDKVAAGKGATAVVAMPDGSRLKLKELSSITLELKGGEAGFGALLSLGGVFARVAKRGAGSPFRVRAGAATASVRGTEFFTAFGRSAKKGRDLWVCVREGSVDVAAPGAKQALPVEAGQGVLVKSSRELTAPQEYDWTKKLNWNMEPEKGAVADKTDLDKAYADLLDQDYR